MCMRLLTLQAELFSHFISVVGGCFCWGIIHANGVSKLLMMVRTMWYQFTQVKLSIE